MNKSQLTISIPTIDRLDYLSQLLDSILPVSEELGFYVCVSANVCKDATHSYLVELEKRFSRLKVYYHVELLSIDENMLYAIHMATTEYVFPLGDDDFVSRESVVSILNLLGSSDHDLVLLNCIHSDPTLKPLREHLPKNMLGVEIDDPVSAFYVLWNLMPFGSFLAKKYCFDISFSNKYLGTSHAYTGVIWEALLRKYNNKSISIYCMEKKTVFLRGAVKTWCSSKAYIMYHEIPLWFNLIAINAQYRGVALYSLTEYLRGLRSNKALFINYFSSNDYSFMKISPVLNSNVYDRVRLCILSVLPRRIVMGFLRIAKKELK